MRDIAVEIPKPCSADWDAMEPEARSRFCAECRTRVHDLSSMTETEAERFLGDNAEREDLCVSYLENADGAIVFAQPRIIPARALLRRLPVAAGFAAAMAACTPAAELCEDEAPAAVAAEPGQAADVKPNPSTRSLLAHPEDALEARDHPPARTRRRRRRGRAVRRRLLGAALRADDEHRAPRRSRPRPQSAAPPASHSSARRASASAPSPDRAHSPVGAVSCAPTVTRPPVIERYSARSQSAVRTSDEIRSSSSRPSKNTPGS